MPAIADLQGMSLCSLVKHTVKPIHIDDSGLENCLNIAKQHIKYVKGEVIEGVVLMHSQTNCTPVRTSAEALDRLFFARSEST